MDETADPVSKGVGKCEEGADHNRSADEIGKEKPPIFHAQHPRGEIKRTPQADQKAGHKKRLNTVLLNEILDRFLAFVREKTRPPRVRFEHPCPKEAADSIHQAIPQKRSHQAGWECVIPVQRTGATGHACRNNRHFFRHGQADAGEREKQHNAEVGPLLKPLDHRCRLAGALWVIGRKAANTKLGKPAEETG